MKMNLLASFSLVALALLLAGCGQQNQTSTSNLPSNNLGVVAINGTLNAGALSSGSQISAAGTRILATASSALADYQVAAVSKSTGKVYLSSSKTDTSGNFSITGLPSGEAYYLDMLNSGSRLAAPITAGSNGTDAVMAITPSGDVNLGQIVYDSSKGSAAPTQEPTALLDPSAVANVKTGETLVPKGAGNLGKGSDANFSGSYDSNNVDGDKDGLPNFFDADNNGDGVVDELDGLYTMEAIGTLAIPDINPYVFTNLKIDYDNRNTFQTSYSEFTLAVGITINPSSSKTIDSAAVIDGPSWLTKAKVTPGTTLWSSTSYDIPPQGGGSYYEVQLNNLVPGTDTTAGDTLTFQINYTDGTSEEVIKMINFVFTDIPRVTDYKIGSASWVNSSSFPGSGSLATASTSEVSLRWTRPKDETGTEITGGRYTWEYNATGGNVREVEIISKDTSTATSLEGSYVLGSLSDASFSGSDFMIGVCIRSVANDNAAENIRFNKGW